MSWISTFFSAKPKNQQFETVQTFPDAITGEDAIPLIGGQLMPQIGGASTISAKRAAAIKNNRCAAGYNEIAAAVDEVVETMVVNGEMGEPAVMPMLSAEFDAPAGFSERLTKIWDDLYNRMDLDFMLSDLVRSWYIDGSLFVHPLFDEKSGKYFRLVKIDPLNINRVRLVDVKASVYTGLIGVGVDVDKKEDLIYVYNNTTADGNRLVANVPTSFTAVAASGDTILYSDSGIQDQYGFPVSHISKSIIAYNTVRQLEAAMSIYRLSRAPERRVFYIDPGALTGKKAEEYIERQMERFRSRLTYDYNTGAIDDGKGGLSITEDFWLAKRDSSGGTSIETLNGLSNAGMSTEDIQFEHERLMRSLDVPASRLQDESGPFQSGDQITYAEYKFRRKIQQFQTRFARQFLTDLFTKQLIASKIISASDITIFQSALKWKWLTHDDMAESREHAKVARQLELLNSGSNVVNTFITSEGLIKSVFGYNDDQLKAHMKELDTAKKAASQEEPANED